MLDAHSKIGRQNIQKQHSVFDFVQRAEGVRCQPTGADNSIYDADVYLGEKLIYIMEVKNREYINRSIRERATLRKLSKMGTYLITLKKLEGLRDLAAKKNCPARLYVNLPFDKKILVFQICDEFGRYLFNFKTETTGTFRCCNNFKGKVERVNAFLPINNNPFLTVMNHDA